MRGAVGRFGCLRRRGAMLDSRVDAEAFATSLMREASTLRQARAPYIFPLPTVLSEGEADIESHG